MVVVSAGRFKHMGISWHCMAKVDGSHHLVLNCVPGFREERCVSDGGIIGPCPDLLANALRNTGRGELQFYNLFCSGYAHAASRWWHKTAYSQLRVKGKEDNLP